MAVILVLETATKNCSVALSVDGRCLFIKEQSSDKFIHAESLHIFIQEVLSDAELGMKDLNAVCVSNGPGSYTGLRIGVSAAKGLCFALDIPLIAMNTNDVLANSIQSEFDAILSVIDARRNEVYARVYDNLKNPISKIEAVELDDSSFIELQSKRVCIVGDAAIKTSEILGWKQIEAMQEFPSAQNMCDLAEEAFQQKRFVDVAYHEPFYLKDFIAGKPKKML